MDKEEVIEIFTQYLDDFKVSYRWIPTPADVNYEELSFVTYGMKNSPGEFDETTIDFGTSSLSARSYYNVMGEIIVSLNHERFFELLELINFINQEIHYLIVKSYTGIEEEPQEAIFSPVMAVDDNFNIKYSLLVMYHTLEYFPIETIQMIVKLIPLYLDALAPAVFGIIAGKISLKQAMKKVEQVNKQGVCVYDAPPTNNENDEEDDE